jgi:hypothetical protein
MVARPFEKLKAQAAEAKRAGDVVRCCIPFCPNRSMLSAGVGFDAYYCEYHRAKIARHGHAEYPSIKGKDLRPYTETAQRWIKTELKAGNVRLQHALSAVGGLMATTGRAPSADEIKRWSAEQKANACFARLREAGVRPERIMAAHMAVTAYLADDAWTPQTRDYHLVQTSKAVHRLASGNHKRYEYPVAKREGNIIVYDGSTTTVEVHAYPRSAGQVLRVIGHAIDEACGAIAEEQRETIIALKDARYGKHPCHTPGYEPEHRKKDRAKHEAARKARQQAQEEAKRLANLRRLLRG